ncbi:MAG TPA: hypothetical protein VKG26_15985 [Bacteroidia bacterium]|nr:hypothetical protein [Bacteroidia bacterium]
MKKTIISVALVVVALSTVAFKNANTEKGVTIINTIEVKDFASFKKGFDAGEPVRQKGGIKFINMYQSVDNANMITIVEEAASAEAAKAFFTDPKAKEAMEKAGVTSKPELKILNKVQ